MFPFFNIVELVHLPINNQTEIRFCSCFANDFFFKKNIFHNFTVSFESFRTVRTEIDKAMTDCFTLTGPWAQLFNVSII